VRFSERARLVFSVLLFFFSFLSGVAGGRSSFSPVADVAVSLAGTREATSGPVLVLSFSFSSFRGEVLFFFLFSLPAGVATESGFFFFGRW